MQIPPLRISFSESDREEVLRRIDRCMKSGQMAQGENVREFEKAYAEYLSVGHAVAVSSGGAALEVAMRLLRVEGKEVLVPTNTFAATATGVVLAGGTVRFLDLDPATFSPSLDMIKATATENTVGVIIVHIGGIVTPEIETIRDWCDDNGIWLFEDAAHAHGSGRGGRMAGTFGHAAAFSFFATKVMTSGEGGMLVTNDDSLADRARGLRDYGKSDPWVSYHTEIGSNWRMPEFCAATGIVQLKRLDEFIAHRERIAARYSKALGKRPELTLVLPDGRSSWYKYIVLLPKDVDRDRFKSALKTRGINLPGGVYETPLHRQPVFESLHDSVSLTNAEDACRRHVCLPLYFGMSDEEADYVLRGFLDALEEFRPL